MKKGIYRFSHDERREFARVHPSAGDAAPFLDRETYELLSFTPPFESLPTEIEYTGQPDRRAHVISRFERTRSHLI